MPNEILIAEIENMLSEIIRLGGENERTQIVPNLTVQDANPSGLDGFVIVSDDRDGDNILAKKVGSIIYNNNDLVNVLFPLGGEAIAFQQGSQSTNSGIWEIVPSTSTDIYYDKGDVGIGKSVAPDATLEILDTTQAQLRLTHTDATKFVDFTLDTNHDLTITPSSNGQIILQPTTDSNNFFQIFDADGGIPILRIDAVSEKVIITSDSISYTEQGVITRGQIFVERPDLISLRGAVYYNESDSAARNSQNAFVRGRVGPAAVQNGDRIGDFFYSGHDGTDFNRSGRFGAVVDGAVSANTVPMGIAFDTSETNSGGITQRFWIAADGDILIGTGTTVNGQLHVDQPSTTAAQPVLYLYQADASEEMMEFNTTIGTGNAIEAVGAKTLTTTHFIKVTLPGALTRYIPVGTIA